MKSGIMFVALAAALIGAFTLGQAVAQEGPKEAPDMEAWKELAKPGPEHEAMQKIAGTWTCEVKCWQGPGEPTVTEGAAEFSMVLGDRFLKQEYEGEMMGEPFEGIGYTAFNNATKKWESVWMDSGGTGLMVMTGTETEKGKSWTYKGSYAGPDGAEMKMRYVLKMISDDRQTMEMYCETPAGEMKCMEIAYTRSE